MHIAVYMMFSATLQSARQFRENYGSNRDVHQQQQDFRSRDVRLMDSHYLQQAGFTVCREGAVPLMSISDPYHQQQNQQVNM